jgi:hypothetical protein
VGVWVIIGCDNVLEGLGVVVALAALVTPGVAVTLLVGVAALVAPAVAVAVGDAAAVWVSGAVAMAVWLGLAGGAVGVSAPAVAVAGAGSAASAATTSAAEMCPSSLWSTAGQEWESANRAPITIATCSLRAPPSHAASALVTAKAPMHSQPTPMAIAARHVLRSGAVISSAAPR